MPERILSPEEFHQARLLSPDQLRQAKFPILPPPVAPRDATAGVNPLTGKDERTNPDAVPQTGLARILTQYVASPIMEHPLATAASIAPPIALYQAGMMGKDLTEYAAQRAAELTLSSDVRRLAEADPTRIPGERAAVEALMFAAAPLIHGAVKAFRGPAAVPSMEIRANVPRSDASGLPPTAEGILAEAKAHIATRTNETAGDLSDMEIPARHPANTERANTDVALAAAGGERFSGLPVTSEMRSVIGKHVDAVHDALLTIASPASRTPEAFSAANILRATTGEMAGQYEQAAFKLDEFRRSIEPLPEADKLGFIDAIEGGASQATPEFQKAADTMRTLLDGTRDAIRKLGTGKLEHFIEDYFPHIWKDAERAGDAFKTTEGADALATQKAKTGSRRPMAGSGSFLKERTIPTTAEGMAMGLEPVSTNPVDLTLLKLREMQRYLAAHTALTEMKDAGLVKFVGAGAAPPEGYVRINDKIATVFGPREGAVTLPEGANILPDDVGVPGTRIMGEYWAPEAVGAVVNNHLSPGLRGNAIYDAYRGLGNTLNQAQLGLSAFHLGFTSMDASVSRSALGLEYLASGQPVKGLSEILSAPVAPVTNAFFGKRIRAAYLNPEGATPEMRALANAVKEAGGRVRQDSFYKTSAPERLITAWKAGEYGKSAVLSVPALLEYAARPLMDHIVPMQKLGVFGDLATKVLADLPPEASLADRRAALGSAWDSVDNRMGQLVYDNLFWNKTFKDMAMASVRSVGWNIGTIRELGGGIGDFGTMAAKVAMGEKAVLTHRASYVVMLPITAGLYGAAYQYLRTGEGPAEMKDYFFPKTGEVDADGNPERVQMASYMKDMFSYAGHPWDTVKHKMSPILSSVYEMLQNEDFYGDEIRNPEDPAVLQVKQEAAYIAKQVVPFSFRGAQEQTARGDQSKITKFGNWFGITPAPRTRVRSDAQNQMADYLSSRKVTGSTPEDAAAAQSRAEILSGLRGNTGVDLQQAVSDAIERHQLTAPDLARLLKRAGSTPAQEKFKRLTVPQALDVFSKSTDREKALFAELLIAKVEKAAPATRLATH